MSEWIAGGYFSGFVVVLIAQIIYWRRTQGWIDDHAMMAIWFGTTFWPIVGIIFSVAKIIDGLQWLCNIGLERPKPNERE